MANVLQRNMAVVAAVVVVVIISDVFVIIQMTANWCSSFVHLPKQYGY